MTTSAVLSPGVKSLHLSLDTPVDAITGKIRNDLSGIRVWYSTQSGFNPNNSEGTLVFDGISSNITIPNLSDSTQYYVRYAFISAIDPTVYTISSQLGEITYDTNVSVYGNLTNPSQIVATATDGSGGDYTTASGTYRVYSYSTEVTGQGVTYAIQTGSITGGLSVSINSTTGVYTVTDLTSDFGSVQFNATYNGITISAVLSVIKAKAGVDGTNAMLLTLIATGTVFVFKDANESTSDTSSIQLTANRQNFTGSITWTAKAYTATSTLLGDIEFTTVDNKITITNSQFNPTGYNNQVAYVIVTASHDLVSDTITLYRINNGTDQIIVEFTNESHTIPAYYDGTVVSSGYVGSGTQIRVKQGNQYLSVDNSAPYAKGTWTVTNTTADNITPDTTPGVYSNYIDYDTHSNMTANRAYIDYTISGTSLSGAAFSIVRRQSFAKSVAGQPGATASLVSLTTTQLVFIKYKDGTYSSNSVTIYANVQNIPTPVYTWSDGTNTVVKDSTTTANADQYVFNRPANLGVYTISVSVSDKNLTSLNTAVDTISIAFIEEGSDAYNFIFKDPNAFYSANASGILEGSITSITNHIIGAKGIALLTPGTNIVYTIDSTENCTATLGSVTGTWNQEFTISGSFFNTGSITTAKVVVKCSVPNTTTYFLMTCYLTKVRKGDTGTSGTSARTVDLTMTAQAFAYNAAGTTPSPSTSTVTATAQNTSGTVYYEFILAGITVQNTTTNTYTYTPAANFSSMPQQIKVNIREGANTGTVLASDVMSLIGIKPGTDGANAVSGLLTNEAAVVSADAAGTVGSFSSAGGTFKVFDGITDKTTSGSVTYSVATSSNVTISINSSGVYTITAMSADTAIATLRAVYGSVTIDKIYSIAKSKTGATGATGSSGSNGTNGINAVKSTSGYIYYTSSTGLQPATPTATYFYFSTGTFVGLSSGWSTTVTMTGNGTYWAARYVVTESAYGTDYGTPTFSAPFNHQNFSSLVTFSNLSNSGQTSIHGGSIITGTISVDSISSSLSSNLYGTQFGFGNGTAVSGTIATVGYFRSTRNDTLGLGVLSSSNMAFAASTVWSSWAGGFGNRYGYGIDDLATGNNRTNALFCAYNVAGYLNHRDTGYYTYLATDSYAINANGPVNITNGSLTLNGSSVITTGSSPSFGNIYSSTLTTTGNIGIAGSIYVGSNNSLITGTYSVTNYPSSSIPYFSGVTIAANNGSIGINGAFVARGTPGFVGYNGSITSGINYGGNGFWTDGSTYSAGGYTGSSRRLKDSIESIDIGLDFILSLEPVKFNLKATNAPKVGFIAEDFPDSRFVSEGYINPVDPSKGKQIAGLDYSAITAPLVKAIHELNAKIIELQQEVQTLKQGS